ncbi:MAG: aspartyl protease family protein [Bacteroidales bacterium]
MIAMKINKIKIFWMAAALLLLNSCGLTADFHTYLGYAVVEDPEPSAVHFDLVGNIIVLKVAIGDEDTTWNFIFDTGAFTIVDQQLADYLDLQPEKRMVVGGSGGRSGLIGLARISEMRVGNTIVHNVGTGITDLSGIGDGMGFPLHGILGNNFMEQFVITINYKDETFIIDTANHLQEDGLVFSFRQEIGTSNAPRISAYVDETYRFDMIFDTGYDGMISLPIRTIKSLPYDTTRLLKAIGVMSGGLFGNASADWMVKPGTLRFGPLSFEDIICSSNHLEVGLIGGGLLRMAETTIDYPARKMVIRPFDNFQPLQSYFGTGMNAVKDYNGNFVITGIWPGSASSRAGLKPGDIITAVNDIVVKNKHSMWFWHLDEDPEVNPLKFTIRRKSGDENVLLHKSHLLKNDD